MARAARQLSEDDRAVWAFYAREVRALPGHTAPEPPPLTAPIASQAPPAVGTAPRALAPSVARLAIGAEPAGLDRASWTRLRAGRLAPTRTLDLHGRTAERAFHALRQFLTTAHADQVRCVEIITGRGDGEARGVIRREFPLWLNLPELRPLVLAACHPHAANPGSVRLLLRRAR